MRVVVSHLTRMAPGFICVAGIDPDTGKHIRPTLPGRLPAHLPRSNGGVFEIGAVVDLGKVRATGRYPEIEDHVFQEFNLRFDRILRPDAFWRVLKQSSTTTLKSIFGPDLCQQGRGCATSQGSGRASLGCLSGGAVELKHEWGKVKLQIDDGTFTTWLSVTDVRIYDVDQTTPRSAVLSQLATRLRKEEVLVSVGLSRPWKKPEDSEARHWLQVNNLHFATDPLGVNLFSI